jgi:putative flippase GtrA
MIKYRNFLLFAVIGAAGFFVDAGTLWVAMTLKSGLFLGRAISYLIAASFTWVLNRRVTFQNRDTNLLFQWMQFLAVNSFGGAVNYSVYVALVLLAPLFASQPVLAVGVGSMSGLIFNYTLSKKIVFRHS